jgi:bifunctional N-acetylglucosamine-1-phosphate-uridyltransferase/glucosamine-1-phosphate-acetyltransferase GlmU-like protein
MSYYLFNTPDLLASLGELRADNAQKEYYITDVPKVLLGKGKRILALPVLKDVERLGVNTLDDLKAVEDAIQAEG